MQDNINELSYDSIMDITGKLKSVLPALSAQIKQTRELIMKQTQNLQIFEALSQTNGGWKKHQYALLHAKAILHDARTFVKQSLQVMGPLMLSGSQMSGDKYPNLVEDQNWIYEHWLLMWCITHQSAKIYPSGNMRN